MYMKRIAGYFFTLLIMVTLFSCQKELKDPGAGDNANHTLKLKIRFRNMVLGDSLVLGQTYQNFFGESYQVSKYKYYISNIILQNGSQTWKDNGYYLVNAEEAGSLSFVLNTSQSQVSAISFMLGVDSIRNVSGAQTGALDPIYGMLWDWNSGYIMAKLEGSSPSSPAVNNSITYHIGGFKGSNKVLRTINFVIPNGRVLTLAAGKQPEIIFESDVNSWFKLPFDLTIADNPTCTSPGDLANKFASNYAKMFILREIKE
jgi:hypothetical protein